MLMNHIQAHEICHFFQDQFSAFIVVIFEKDLKTGEAMALRFVTFNILHGRTLPAPGMIDHQLSIYAEFLIQHIRIRCCDSSLGHDPELCQVS